MPLELSKCRKDNTGKKRKESIKMYVDNDLKSMVEYRLGKNSNGLHAANVIICGKLVANLLVPRVEIDIEEAQKHIYRVARSYMRMMGIQAKK